MTPKHQNRRIIVILFCTALLAIGTWLLLSALKQNTQFFYDPSEILTEGFEPRSEKIRIGGLVLSGSVVKGEGLETRFHIADFPKGKAYEMGNNAYVTVTYSGILPDLFREGQGVVVSGILDGQTSLKADDVLAKHDENYQPKK